MSLSNVGLRISGELLIQIQMICLLGVGVRSTGMDNTVTTGKILNIR